MTVTATPIFPQSIQNWVLTLNNASGTTSTSFITAGTNGTKIENIYVTSTDTSARDVVINIFNSSTNYAFGIVNVAITAGTVNTVPSVNLLTASQLPNLPRDSNGNPYLYLANGYNLYIQMPVAITSGKVFTFFAQGGNF